MHSSTVVVPRAVIDVEFIVAINALSVTTPSLVHYFVAWNAISSNSWVTVNFSSTGTGSKPINESFRLKCFLLSQIEVQSNISVLETARQRYRRFFCLSNLVSATRQTVLISWKKCRTRSSRGRVYMLVCCEIVWNRSNVRGSCHGNLFSNSEFVFHCNTLAWVALHDILLVVIGNIFESFNRPCHPLSREVSWCHSWFTPGNHSSATYESYLHEAIPKAFLILQRVLFSDTSLSRTAAAERYFCICTF